MIKYYAKEYVRENKLGAIMSCEDSRTAEVIKFDLHIHSFASKYKEAHGIVDGSTKENLKTLFSKLEENKVSLFSITDHNRFDVELYEEIDRIIRSGKYPCVKNVLAGIEFDVKLEKDMSVCHIIGIFDAKNSMDNYERIKSTINKNLLTKKDDYHTKEKFEEVLKDINMDTILIASQRKDITNHSGNNSSLSDSVSDVEKVMQVGYIDALEFQKPKVEGILSNSLKNLPNGISLISGSDCHEWNCYPGHDKKNRTQNFHHSKSRMMPTFKGLLMTVSSPETRLNCIENSNSFYIKEIEINGKKISFINGLNAIIGENGSGKSTILELIGKKKVPSHVKQIIEKNGLNAIKNGSPIIKYISQGQIIENFNKGKLFDEAKYPRVDDGRFIQEYTEYSRKIKEYIDFSIEKNKLSDEANQKVIMYESNKLGDTYYIHIDKDIVNNENIHKKKLKDIEKVIANVNDLLQDEYFSFYFSELKNSKVILEQIRDKIFEKNRDTDFKVKVETIVMSFIKTYDTKISNESASRDKEIMACDDNRQKFISAVLDVLKDENNKILWPEKPKIIDGTESETYDGFQFGVVKNYNQKDMVEEFYSKMFVKKYEKEECLKKINTVEKFISAITGCTDVEDINDLWQQNFIKFKEESTQCHRYVREGASENIGNTLGEMSLSFYKYFTQSFNRWNVLMVDQPEDNISNNNISLRLIDYFKSLKSEKQVIFVTHNPLMVVNMDVENVIFLRKNDNFIEATNGCLEYECDGVNILNLIAENMDGGRETIERRLRVYGKKN